MSTRKDIAEVIGYMKLAFPNYSPDVTSPINTLDVLSDLLGDIPSEILNLAVKAACAEAGRAFAPAAGEIREAALRLSVRASEIPNEFEAWAEVCKMPKNMILRQIEVDEAGNMVTNELGRVMIQRERLTWSHALVQQTALQLGWPDFPGEDESLDRAHFFQAYRAAVKRMMEEAGELPTVRQYIEEQCRGGKLMIGQALETIIIKDAP
jgi:hypothetical protein